VYGVGEYRRRQSRVSLYRRVRALRTENNDSISPTPSPIRWNVIHNIPRLRVSRIRWQRNADVLPTGIAISTPARGRQHVRRLSPSAVIRRVPFGVRQPFPEAE